MSVGAITQVPAIAATSVETKFRRGLWVASILSGLVLLSYCGTMLWAQNSLSPQESMVAAQSLMLAHTGHLYYDLNQYPYTICAYMPIFYWLDAGFIRLGLPVFAAVRTTSFTALLGLIAVCWRLALLYTGNRNAAWVAAILTASSSLLGSWGTIGQVDTLAIFFSVTAFYYYSRFHVKGESTLLLAGVFAALGVFTKQTMLSAPTAILILLSIRDPKKALRFGLVFGTLVGGTVLAINAALHGRFLANTVLGNVNPLSPERFLVQVRYAASVSAGLLVILSVSLRSTIRARAWAPCVYLALAVMVFLATAIKTGSDTNYQMELTVVLAVCTAIGLHHVNFFSLYFDGGKSWITLLLLPLALHAAVGYRVSANALLARVASEKLYRPEVEALRPYVDPVAGRVISTDYNAMVRLRQKVDVEPMIYRMLVASGAVDQEPVRRDIARSAFSTIIMNEDVFNGGLFNDLEIGSLTPSQIEEVRKHYHLVQHIPGPFLDGVFVYQPSGGR